MHFSLTNLFKQIDEFVRIEVSSTDVERGHVGKKGEWQEVAELFLSKHEPEWFMILAERDAFDKIACLTLLIFGQIRATCSTWQRS